MKNLPESFFARNLLFLMDQLGATQDNLADDLGITHTAISKYLRGRVPKAEILVLLSEIFGVQVRDLLYRDLQAKTQEKRVARPNSERLTRRLAEMSEERAEFIAKALLSFMGHIEAAMAESKKKTLQQIQKGLGKAR